MQNDIQIGFPTTYNGIDLPVHFNFIASEAHYKIFVAHRRAIKTSICLGEMAKYLLTTPNIIGRTYAPQRKQAKEIIWDNPAMLFSKFVFPPEVVANVNHSELKVTLINGSVYYLDGADTTANTKRGLACHVLHLTEAGDHSPTAWSQIFEPIIVQAGGIALFEGNPRGKNWYFDLWNHAEKREGWERFFLSAEESPIFTKAELADIKAHIPTAVWEAEYLCKWVDIAGTVFRNLQACSGAVTAGPVAGCAYRAGVDLGKMQDFTAISVVDRSKWHQCFTDRFNQIDWPTQKDRIKSIATTYGKRSNMNQIELVIESNGVGDPIFDDIWSWAMSDEVMKEYDILVTPFRQSAETKSKLVSNLSLMLDLAQIQLINDPIQLREIAAFTYKKTMHSFQYSAPDGEHDDTVMACMLSFYQLSDKIPLKEDVTKKSYFGIPSDQIKNSNSDQSGIVNPFFSPHI